MMKQFKYPVISSITVLALASYLTLCLPASMVHPNLSFFLSPQSTFKQKAIYPARLVCGSILLEKNGFIMAIQDGDKVTTEAKKTIPELLSWLTAYASINNVKILAMGIVGGKNKVAKILSSELWKQQDIEPLYLKLSPLDIIKNNLNSLFTGFKNSIASKSGLAEKSRQKLEIALRMVNEHFQQKLVLFEKNSRQVKVNEWLTSLKDFEKTVSKYPGKWKLFKNLQPRFKNKKMVYFSSTPQGGGVALMRHAIIRLSKLAGLDVEWHVLLPDPAVFTITKTKFHNVFQGVADKGTLLNDTDKKIFNAWSEKNAKYFKKVIKSAAVIVIDDYQPSGLIPFIKLWNPKCKIIYRSHIQFIADLEGEKETAFKESLSFILQNIQGVNSFFFHPTPNSIPPGFPLEKAFLMGAASDLYLDGLNKMLNKKQQLWWLSYLNLLLKQGGQSALDINRPYITQIARFDPSKGIKQTLDSLLKLRQKLEDEGQLDKMPQLILAAHGAVDDIQGKIILGKTKRLLRKREYAPIAEDVKLIQLPHTLKTPAADDIREKITLDKTKKLLKKRKYTPIAEDVKLIQIPHTLKTPAEMGGFIISSDQILNAILSQAKIALQLSIAEGFEIKISEALAKGIPVIISRVGGMPEQVINGINGYICEIQKDSGNRIDTAEVAEYLFELLTDDKAYKTMSKNARDKVKDNSTVDNFLRWLLMAVKLIEEEEIKSSGKNVYWEEIVQEEIKRLEQKENIGHANLINLILKSA